MCNWGCTCLSGHRGPTFCSNVISIMPLTTILGGLMSGSIYMFEVFINIYCAFDFRMMSQSNGLFELLGGNISMEPTDCMGMC